MPADRNGLVAIPAAAYLEPVPTCTRRFETRYVQIQCNTGTYSQTFFPSAIWLWNTLPVDICQLSPESFKSQDPSQQFPFHSSTGLRPVFIVCTALFSSEVTVHRLLHGFLGTHLLIHSWCDIARNRVGTVIGRWWNIHVICIDGAYNTHRRFFLLAEACVVIRRLRLVVAVMTSLVSAACHAISK